MGARLRAAIGATVGGTSRRASGHRLSGDRRADPRVVTVATHDLEPFVMTQGAIKSGFTIDLLEAIAKREDWTLSYVDVANVAEQLKAVSDRRVDAAATAISITADRTKDYDFSQPILNSGSADHGPHQQARAVNTRPAGFPQPGVLQDDGHLAGGGPVGLGASGPHHLAL